MQTLFFICFGVGVGYIFIGFLLGEIVGLFDMEFDLSGTITPMKPAVISSFFMVFGGVGLIAINHTNRIYALAIAVSLGALVAFLFFRFILTPLYQAQNTSAIEIQSLIGHTAHVSETIPQGRYGKITYYVNGNTYSAPAKSEDGQEIKRSTAVEIMYIERHTYYVKRR